MENVSEFLSSPALLNKYFQLLLILVPIPSSIFTIMKNRATTFVKQILCVLRSVAKSKTMAIKSKTDAIRARLIVFSLLRNRKLSLSAVSDRIQALLGHQQKQETDAAEEDNGDHGKAIVLYNAASTSAAVSPDNTCTELDNCCNNAYHYHYYDDDDKYPDLTHSLFDEDDDGLDLGDPNASVIDLVRNSKEEGENFSLEDEIDHVADLFILKFHKNIRMQKLESFKRYQEMLLRSA